jgi:putative spermidine/putrescine transport system permease protein
VGTTSRHGFLVVALVGPGLCFLFAFLFVPLFQMGVISVYTYSPTRIWLPVLTWDNYHHLLDPYYARVALTTLQIGLSTTLICGVLAYPLAYSLARAPGRWLGIYIFLLVSPLMVSGVIRAFGWLVILDRRGIINQIVQTLGMPQLQLLSCLFESGTNRPRNFVTVCYPPAVSVCAF